MAGQNVFERCELKYMIDIEQKEKIMQAMEPYMALDCYGKATIRNLYFDTDDYRLIRHSIEKPVYKEKLRIRSYGKAEEDSLVYVELKKKHKHVVYKRRVSLTEKEAMKWLCARESDHSSTQISREIDYFMEYYKTLQPRVYLSYEREAYYTREYSDFRVTFDENILCREERLSLQEEAGGVPILEEGKVLMEIKCSGGIPLWMTQILTELHIYKTSFSKYGTFYRNYIYPRLEEEFRHGTII